MRPVISGEQIASNDGHKHKNALKFQTIASPNGLILQAAGHLEGRRHNRKLCMRGGIDEQRINECDAGGVTYYVHSNCGCNYEDNIDVPFQDAHITAAPVMCNNEIALVRLTVQWSYIEVKLYWTTVDFNRKMRVSQSWLGLLYIYSMVLRSIPSSLYPNPVSPNLEWSREQ